MVSFARRGAGGGEESGEETEARRLETIRDALQESSGKGLEEQAEAVAGAMIAEPSRPTTDWMWRTLMIGLLALLGIVLLALIAMLIAGKNTQALSTIFGLVFGGLIGIFVPGPNGSGGSAG
jgi:hypothetical protein